MTDLPRGIGAAFRVAVGELGMCTASWMFVEEVAAEAGAQGVAALRERLGKTWPVLDAVALQSLGGGTSPKPNPTPLLRALEGAERVVCVGLEAMWLDALLAASSLPLILLRQSVFAPDWERIEANHDGRVCFESLDTFQRFAGPRSSLLTFGYAGDPYTIHALPSWVRASGEDVRVQFRDILAWEVLSGPFNVWPRWLVPVPSSSFSAVIR